EEPDLVADLPQLIGERGPVGAGRRPVRERDDGDLVEGHRGHGTAGPWLVPSAPRARLVGMASGSASHRIVAAGHSPPGASSVQRRTRGGAAPSGPWTYGRSSVGPGPGDEPGPAG